ncbi:hypothetical protein [Sphingopyxis fribergensis]|uniref:hypothetical protein n=1 Tax=Sphingopyxis fribergensis TaxID=1515612 RepID=UPI0011DCAFB6|nr:hypothetical protein [Sphingopyxis fribergensis]
MATAPDEPIDDPTIPDEVWALRRVHISQFQNGRPDSSVYKAGNEGIGTSVTLFRGPEDLTNIRAGYPSHGVVTNPVQAFRAVDLGIMYTPEEGNPNHCEVFGQRGKSVMRNLATQARWVVRPEGIGEDQIPELFIPPAH